MFTGIIEETGKIDAIIKGGSVYKLRIACDKVLGPSEVSRISNASGLISSEALHENETEGNKEDFDAWEIPTKIGDSIAVNGICLTVTEIDGNTFTADVMPETLSRTSLASARTGSAVNLERAMPAYGRFGGHIVSGHIDGIGEITSIRKDGNAIWYEIRAGKDLMDLIVKKGSIAIDGISLTVAETGKETFKVSVIPHTIEMTTLPLRKVGSKVNLETDIVGKYTRKLIGAEPKEKKGSLSDRELYELL